MILHIEDDSGTAELARHALSKANQPVVWLNDGQLALDFILKQGNYFEQTGPSPQMILLDLHLPSVPGLDILRQVKASPLTANIPVVVLTSSEDEADIARSRQYGADAYLVKPTDAIEYSTLVRGAVRQWAGSGNVCMEASLQIH